MTIKVTRTTRATGNQLVSEFCTREDVHEYVMYSHYDNTGATKGQARGIANTLLVFGHPVNQLETEHYLWTIETK